MVWPFNSGSGSNNDANRDPLKDLDPSLRAFLERESPIKYAPPKPEPAKAAKPSPDTPPPHIPSPSAQQSASPASNESSTSVAANIPTLYKDGRYAHLWATYKPLAKVEAEGTSPQDKLADILAGYRDRKASIGRAALENCAVEQFNLNDCYRNGDMSERFTNCRSYMKKLDRCYTMNQRLLRALGYLGDFNRPAEMEERIQMHADKLYQTMVEQEAIDFRNNGTTTQPEEATTQSSAGAVGTNTPSQQTVQAAQTEALLRRDYDTTIDPSIRKIVEELRPQVRAQYADRLRELSPAERALEERALAMEMIAGKDVLRTVTTLRDAGVSESHQRIKRGEGTFGDQLSKFLGW